MQTHASLLAHVLMLAVLSAMGREAVMATANPECYVEPVVCGVAVPSLSLSLTANRISTQALDGSGRSRMAMHVDTAQLLPAVVSSESIYPHTASGRCMQDMGGGEFVWADGFHVEKYGRRDLILTVGHRCLHVPLSPLPRGPGDSLEPIRMSATHWSTVGSQYRDASDHLRLSHGGFSGASNTSMEERAVLEQLVAFTSQDYTRECTTTCEAPPLASTSHVC